MDQVKDEESQQHQFGGVSEDEHVGLLIQKEVSFGFKKDAILMFDESLKRARFNAINWIFKVCFFFIPFFSFSISSIINETAIGKKL